MARNNRKNQAPAAPPEPDDRTIEYRRGDTGEQPSFADLGRDERWSRGEAPPAVPLGPKRARTGLVTSVTFLLLLVAVAAGGNQGVSDMLADRVDRMEPGYLPAGAALTYGWRFSARGGHDVGHAWLAQLVTVAAFIVLATLLVAPVVRGVVTWFRAFFGVLGAIVVATALAEMVGAAIRTGSAATPRGITRAERILFFSSDGPTVLASLVVGVVAALIVASVAVGTRRAPMAQVGAPAVAPAHEAAPEVPPPYYGEPERDWRAPQHEPNQERSAGSATDVSGDDRWVPSSGPWNAPDHAATGGLVGGAAPEAPRHADGDLPRESDPNAATSSLDAAAVDEPRRHDADDAHTAQLPAVTDEARGHDAAQHDAAQHDAAQHDAAQHDAAQHDAARHDGATQQFPRLPDDEHDHPVSDEELPHRDDRPGTAS